MSNLNHPSTMGQEPWLKSHSTNPPPDSNTSSINIEDRKVLYEQISVLAMLIKVPEMYLANNRLIPNPEESIRRKLKSLPAHDVYGIMIRMVCQL